MTACECIDWARTDSRLTDHHPRCPKFKEQRYVRVTLAHHGCYVQPEDQLQVLLDEIRESEVGARWTVELIEMTVEEYERLPEFAGH